jgi:tRNA-dihydrouridine synthase
MRFVTLFCHSVSLLQLSHLCIAYFLSSNIVYYSLMSQKMSLRSFRRSFGCFSNHSPYISPSQLDQLRSLSFWERINKPKFIAAPMVDQSELAFRLLVRQNGCDLTFTQMINSRVFITNTIYRKSVVDWCNYRPALNVADANSIKYCEEDMDRVESFNRGVDRPLIVQFNGNDPETLLKACNLLLERTPDISAIDLNLGCPQAIARRGHYGGYFLNDKARRESLLSLLKTMVRDLSPLPITVKIRKLTDDNDSGDKTVELCQRFEDIGISMITIHGRTTEQSKTFIGPTDWRIIKRIKSVTSIPIVANGGISSIADADRCFEETGVDCVMSSEALLENPKLFNRQNQEAYKNDYINNQLQTTLEYLELAGQYPLPSSSTGVQGHLFKLLHCFIHATCNHDLRERLIKDSHDVHKLISLVHELQHRLSPFSQNNDVTSAANKGYFNRSSWYFRHRSDPDREKKLCLPRGGLPY